MGNQMNNLPKNVPSIKIDTSTSELEVILHVGKSGLFSIEDKDNDLLISLLSQEQLIELRNFLNEHVKDRQ